MPYVQQSRVPLRAQGYYPFEYSRNGVVYDSGSTATELRPGYLTENTYSWRTGRAAPLATASDVIGVSGEDMRNELRRTGDIQLPQSMSSESNPYFPYDTGHTFWTEKGVQVSTPARHHIFGADRWEYTGPLFAVLAVNGSTWPELHVPSQGTKTSWGNRLYASAVPTRPDANLMTLVAETAQRIPQLPALVLLRDRNLRSIGGEYLNYEFGIAPMIRDILKACEAVVNFNHNLQNFQEHAGKPQHRRREVLLEDESVVVGEAEYNRTFPSMGRLNASYMTSTFFDSGVGVSILDQHKVRAWFSGSFVYYLHTGSDFLSRMARYGQLAEKLLGAGLTVQTFWELAPWSWLVDWQIDVGSFLRVTNRNASDGLVTKYSYLMVETSATRSFTSTATTSRGGTPVPPLVTEHLRVRKERIRGTPYGFGLNLEVDMTAKRWAILAALGLTKSPSKLRTTEPD